MSVRELGHKLRSQVLTAVEITEYLLEYIDTWQPTLNAFTYIARASALEAARHSDSLFAAGTPRSLLEGIPVAIKDNIYVEGMPFVFGTPLFKDRIAEQDELPIALLKAGGAVIIGKTNLPEFASRGSTFNSVYGATANPWNPSLTTGGSSGGSVAAVASGMVPLSLGTDGGGSIRRPSGYTNLVGLKPTIARIPRADGFTSVLYDCEVVGPIGRSVDDVRIMMSVIATPNRRDQRSRQFEPIAADSAVPSARKILFVPHIGEAPVDPQIQRRCEEAMQVLADLGHEITVGQLPFDLSAINANWASIGNVCLSLMAKHAPRFNDCVAEDFVARAAAGFKLSGADYQEIIEILQAFRSEVGESFADFDFIMTPTSAANPWEKTKGFPETIDGQPVGPRGHAVFTGWVNACGHPAIALPCGFTNEGMPVGFQLVGDFGADASVLDMASQYESARPGTRSWPKLSQ
jgi:aspartyl-tRNA(Asn)/glutamyl-tRNA(Gln) amidotransferase subunit A